MVFQAKSNEKVQIIKIFFAMIAQLYPLLSCLFKIEVTVRWDENCFFFF